MEKLLLVLSLALAATLVCSLPTHLRMHLRGKRAFSYIANQTVCVVDNVVFHDGDPIPTDDPCESCKCRPPGFSCVLRECEVKPGCKAIRRDGECCPEYQCGCEHNGKFYNDGDRIPNAESPCYSCYCQGSSITCALADCKFRFDCEPEYVPGECCPRYDHCPPDPSQTTTSTLAPTTFAPTSIFTTLIPTTVTQEITRVTNITTTEAPITLAAVIPADEPVKIVTVAPTLHEESSTTALVPETVKDIAEKEGEPEATTLPSIVEIAVTNDVTTSTPEAIRDQNSAVVTEQIINEPTTLSSVDVPTVAGEPQGVRDESVASGDREDVTTLPSADAVVVEVITTTRPNELIQEEPVVTVDAITEEKLATASLSEEAYMTTKSWLPDSSLVAEHKETDDFLINTVIPPIIADTLEFDVTEPSLRPETLPEQSPSNNTVVLALEPAISNAIVTSQPDEVVTERLTVVNSASETTTLSASSDEASNSIF